MAHRKKPRIPSEPPEPGMAQLVLACLRNRDALLAFDR
jgi:hypothetical protein